MPVYKDEVRGSWFVSFYYENAQGEKKKKMKRGFKTKREAEEFISKFILVNERDLDMKFDEFIEIYLNDLSNRIKENTMMTKVYIINDKILPFFKLRKMNEIKPSHIIAW